MCYAKEEYKNSREKMEECLDKERNTDQDASLQ